MNYIYTINRKKKILIIYFPEFFNHLPTLKIFHYRYILLILIKANKLTYFKILLIYLNKIVINGVNAKVDDPHLILYSF